MRDRRGFFIQIHLRSFRWIFFHFRYQGCTFTLLKYMRQKNRGLWLRPHKALFIAQRKTTFFLVLPFFSMLCDAFI